MKKIKFFKFLKPNFSKILFFLLLLMIMMPLVLSSFGIIRREVIPVIKHIPEFIHHILYILSSNESLFSLIAWTIYLIFLFIPLMLCDGPDGKSWCLSEYTPKFVVFIVFYTIPTIVLWLMACFIGFVWEKLLGKKGKIKFYGEIVVGIFIFFLFLIGILFPLIGPYFVSVQKDTVKEIRLINDGVIQHIKLKNNFFTDVAYRLPYPLLCYSFEKTIEKKYDYPYYYFDLERQKKVPFIESTFKPFGYTVFLKKNQEKDIYLTTIFFIYRKDFHKVFLLESKKEITNPSYYCNHLTEKELKNAKEINVVE